MNLLKGANLKSTINYSLFIWITLWLFFALFNWDVFIIKINTDFGFGVFSTIPFLVFFIIGTGILFVLQFAATINESEQIIKQKDADLKIKMLEKNMEILRLKEVIFKMQSSELNKSTASLNLLQDKIEKLSKKESNSDKNKKEKDVKE